MAVEAPHMIFTGLEDYKARGTQAAPYLTTTFYTELSETKDLVFIRGDVVFTSKLTDEEAKWIMETAQSFYLNDSRYKLLERFNKHTHDFEFKDVLQALDMPVLWFAKSGKKKTFLIFEFLIEHLVVDLILYGIGDKAISWPN